MAQRLSRRLCEDSRTAVKVTGRAAELIEEELRTLPEGSRRELGDLRTAEIYEGKVSPTCPKGTRGRIGLFEVFQMTPELERIILEGPSESKIAAEARRQGMATMKQDGILKVRRGIIGIRELLEVV